MVNESITDHAAHIDHTGERLEIMPRPVRSPLAPRAVGQGRVGSYVEGPVNDDELKAQVASRVQFLGDEFEKLKTVQVEAQRDLVKLLDGRVREMESNIEKFKAAVGAAAPADSSVPMALRLGNVESTVATLVARADAADVAAAASVAATAAAAARDQIVEATFRDLNAPMGSASAGGPPPSGQAGASNDQSGTDPMAGGNDTWARLAAGQRRDKDQQQPQGP